VISVHLGICKYFASSLADLKIRDYVDRLQEINNYLVHFPLKEGETDAPIWNNKYLAEEIAIRNMIFKNLTSYYTISM
jgi:hypothetical protein